jgi:hypothetical protein
MKNVSSIAAANRIFSLRDTQIMLDRDLAELYQVTTKALNQAVKRNNARFPFEFKFQLTPSEMTQLVTECDRFSTLKHSSVMPYAFTEQGVAMLSAILKSELAIEISIQIMNAFVAMRKQRNQLHTVISRIESIEVKQAVTENKLNTVLVALECEKAPKQGVFFEGQLFDAYVFASDLIRQAKISIEMIDNYVDERTFMLLSKRNKGVSCTIYTRKTAITLNDLERHNTQYPTIKLINHCSSHDRFIIIDNRRLYHLGASLKDLGKRCFAFSQMDDLLPLLRKNLLQPPTVA